MGQTFAGIAADGPIVVAMAVAALAGLVSFLSPCVLPLVPGYLGYMTGLAGSDLSDALNRPTARARGRILLGALGFIAGLTVVFTLTGIIVAGVGRAMLLNQRALEIGGGVLIVVLGVAFLGWVPGLQRQWRPTRLPAAGLAGAPLLGGIFALSWVPCTGPTLTAILTLSLVDGSPVRAATLTVAYCLGLGLPFLIFGLGFRKLIGVTGAVRRHSRWVTGVGGAVLIAVGLALATGVWGDFLAWLKAVVGPGSVGI